MTWNQLIIHEPIPRGVGDEKYCKVCNGPIEKANTLHGPDPFIGRPTEVNLRSDWFKAQMRVRNALRALKRIRNPEYPQGIRIEWSVIDHERLKWQVEALLSGILTEEQRFGIENEFMEKEADTLETLLKDQTNAAAQLTTPEDSKKLFIAGPGWTPPRG